MQIATSQDYATHSGFWNFASGALNNQVHSSSLHAKTINGSHSTRAVDDTHKTLGRANNTNTETGVCLTLKTTLAYHHPPDEF